MLRPSQSPPLNAATSRARLAKPSARPLANQGILLKQSHPSLNKTWDGQVKTPQTCFPKTSASSSTCHLPTQSQTPKVASHHDMTPRPKKSRGRHPSCVAARREIQLPSHQGTKALHRPPASTQPTTTTNAHTTRTPRQTESGRDAGKQPRRASARPPYSGGTSNSALGQTYNNGERRPRTTRPNQKTIIPTRDQA